MSSAILPIIRSSAPKKVKAPQTWTGSPAPLPPSRSPSLAHFDDPPRGGLLGDCIGLEPEHLALLEHKPSAYACMQ